MYNIFCIFIGLALLVVGGNALLKSSVALSLKMNISRIVVGLTIVSFATSAPELIVSVNAALSGHSGIAMGNVLGSNIANITLVLGLSLLFGSIQVPKSFFRSDWPIMMATSLLLFFLMYFDKNISRFDGFILVMFLAIFIGYLFRFQGSEADVEDVSEGDASISVYKMLMLLVLGGAGLWAGSELLIKGAYGLAQQLGVSERIISITVVSIGTSIPELATSILAMIKKEKAISLGNLIGSNIFNILAVLGITSLCSPINDIDHNFLTKDVYWMLFSALVLLLSILIFSDRKLNYRQGLMLLLFYAMFVYFAII